ncbi:zinc-containing alcohol dehydrogenase [Fusarium albosuccineum]|uniref:Zinc-containing alcohol dehydrogenase n=1 Tax=Fusarium albosuccineum TaxID=1237068 RepID=A0A8H4LCZ6_9HYPO|nr:zinc-containing alcohol dehydrogenase [Fusarium albosuccineum]
MQAVRIQPSQGREPYSAANPAPSSALALESHVAVPELKPGQVLVRVHATTVTRDELTWPESYHHEYRIPGYDFSGIVERVCDSDNFKPGDEVYAMVSTTRGSTWAEYAMAEEHELALKPKNLSWAESVAVPLSALTAWQALFVKAAGVSEPNFDAITKQKSERTLLVTGASGAVGSYIVQLGVQAGLHVVAASSSTERNGDFLRSLGADEVVEYADLSSKRSFDVIIDTVGGDVLSQAWDLVTDRGSLISVESSSVEFAKAAPAGKEHVNAMFFILEPSGEQLSKLARALELGLVKPFLAYTFPLAEAKAAYEKANGRMDRKGKVVLTL